MPSFSRWLPAGGVIALLAAPAAACSPPPYQPPPMLVGEDEAAYRIRIEAQALRDAEAARVQWEAAQHMREAEMWNAAERVIVAEVAAVSGWREDRQGSSYRLVTLRPLAAARGPDPTRRFRLRSYDSSTACFGPQGPIYPTQGKLVVFARKGTLSDATVLDWSDASLSTHPETLALLKQASGSQN